MWSYHLRSSTSRFWGLDCRYTGGYVRWLHAAVTCGGYERRLRAAVTHGGARRCGGCALGLQQRWTMVKLIVKYCSLIVKYCSCRDPRPAFSSGSAVAHRVPPVATAQAPPPSGHIPPATSFWSRPYGHVPRVSHVPPIPSSRPPPPLLRPRPLTVRSLTPGTSPKKPPPGGCARRRVRSESDPSRPPPTAGAGAAET